MTVPYLRPVAGPLPHRAFDARDPRALDVFAAWSGDKLPEYGLIGVPFDGAVMGRKGAHMGPSAVREALRFSSSYQLEEDVELHGISCADLGDVDVPNVDVAQAHERVTAALKHLWSNGCHPLIVGGDNSITFAAVRALAESGATSIGIFDLDAHMDVRVPEPGPTSGSPYYQLVESVPQVRAKNIIQVGLRRFATSKTYREWGVKKGLKLIPMKEIRRRGFQALLEHTIQAAADGVDALYVSLDMDVVDQAWAPGVSSPSPDGLTPREVFDAVQQAAARKECRGFEVVETAPNLDPTGNTARVAALSLLHYLVGRKMPRPAVSAPPVPRPQAPMGSRGPPSGRREWGGGRPSHGGGRGPGRGYGPRY